MKIKAPVIVSAAVILITLLLLIILKSVPVTKIWKNYTVIYVEKKLSEETVISYLKKSGCDDIISLSNQRAPVNSAFVPVLPSDYGDYLSKRLKYFSDESDNYTLYYVPSKYDRSASRALEILVNEIGVKAGIDGKQQFPFLVPVAALVAFAAFLYLSKNKFAFAFPAVFALLLTFSNPFYPTAAASIIYMLAIYLAQRIWARKKAIQVLKKNLYVLIPTVVSFLVMLLSGIAAAFLMVFTIASGIASCILLAEFEKYAESKISFKYKKIFAAPQLPLMYPSTAMHTLLTLVPLTVLLIAFLLSARFTPTVNEKITLPVPVNANSKMAKEKDTLPVFSDFYKWAWNTKTFPYRNLNEKYSGEVKENDAIYADRFENTEQGISTARTELFKFNKNFRKNAEKELSSMKNPQIELMLKKQDKNIKVIFGNKGKGTSQTDAMSLILILLALLVPPFLYALYTFRNFRKNK